MFKRIFLLVMDGVGVGEAPDADKFGDEGSNTLLHAIGDSYNLNVLEKFGLLDLVGKEEINKRGLYMKARPLSAGKGPCGCSRASCRLSSLPFFPPGIRCLPSRSLLRTA